MKFNVKTLKGTSFEIEAPAEASVAEAKRIIESAQGANVYPADQIMLIYQGKILKDDTTLESNKVAENSFVVVMLSKAKASTSGASTAAKTPAPVTSAQPATPAAPVASVARTAPSQAPVAASEPAPPSTQPPAAAVTATPDATVAASSDADLYSQAASNLVLGSNLEQTIQQILEIGGGTWDRDTVVRALRAAYNNLERAIEYLYSGIPENAEVPPAARAPASGHQTNLQAPPPQAQPTAVPPVQAADASAGPNVNPLNLFPQGIPSGGTNPVAAAGAGAGALDALRQLPQFQALLALVQANPQILQPMLQELGKQNPQLMRLIQGNQTEFLRLVNESPESGSGGNILGAIPQELTVTPEEQEAIQRLQTMGFNRELVLEVFFACDKNEEATANYLLDHGHEFEEQQ